MLLAGQVLLRTLYGVWGKNKKAWGTDEGLWLNMSECERMERKRKVCVFILTGEEAITSCFVH